MLRSWSKKEFFDFAVESANAGSSYEFNARRT